jgi:hydrogenase maturation protease
VTPRILVAGIGNVLLSDDAIGPYCARHIAAHYEFPSHVEVTDLGTPGLDLAVHLSNADVVLLIDALHDGEPATIAVYDLAVASGRRGARLDTHAPALEESILIARLAGSRPRDVRLIGLNGVNFEQGTTLSPEVRAQIPSLAESVLAELTRLNVNWIQRAQAAPLDVWWEFRPETRRAGTVAGRS